jgi:RNA polymerase sigma-70 factor (ECF subfamily)
VGFFFQKSAYESSDGPPPNPPREDPLIVAIKNGSQSAFSEFVNTYKERLFSVVYNIVLNSSDASDITQDVFIKAYNSINAFKSNSSPFTWLYRIAVNMSLSFLRKHKKHSFVSIEQLDESGISPEQLRLIPTTDGSDQSTALKELQKKLNEALQKLSNKHRVVITLFEIEGMSHEQVAKILGCSAGTVRSRLHYAKQQLQGYLREYL